MRIELEYHPAAREGLLRWRQTLGSNEQERAERFRAYFQAMEDHFKAHQGFPPEAYRSPTEPQKVYWWRYTATLRITFVVYERPRPAHRWWDVIRRMRRWVLPTVRTVVLTDVEHPLPPT